MRFGNILPLLAMASASAEMGESDSFLRGSVLDDSELDDMDLEDMELDDMDLKDMELEDREGRDLQFGGDFGNNDFGRDPDFWDNPWNDNQGRPNQGNQGRPNQGGNGVASVYQHSHTFGVYSVVNAEASCFDVKAFCESYLDGYVFTGAIGTLAQAAEELYIYTQCRGVAGALSKSLAEVQAQGQIKVGVSRSDKTNIDVDVQLQSASMTLSMARSKAIAESYIETEANGFTTVDDYCAQVNAQRKPSLLCSGGNNKVEAIGKASAAAFTEGLAAAGAGSTTMTKAAVDVEGRNIHHVKAVLMTVAMNWAWTQSSSASQALSAAYSKTFTKSFNILCLKTHQRECRKKKNTGREICKLVPQEACDKALAVGEAKASGFTNALTRSFASSLSRMKSSVILRAQIYQNGERTWIEFEHDAKAGSVAAISAVCPGFSYAAEE